MTDQEKIAEFLARKGATKCPPGEAKAKSLRQMRREADRDTFEREMGFQREAVLRARGKL